MTGKSETFRHGDDIVESNLLKKRNDPERILRVETSCLHLYQTPR